MRHQHKIGSAINLPTQCVVRERLGQAIASFRLALWTIAFVIGLVLVAWLVEFAINDVNLAVWIAERWYIPSAIVTVTLYSCIREATDKNVNWEQLRELSSTVDEIVSVNAGESYATGLLWFENLAIGQRTVTSGSGGLAIWRRGVPEVYFPWDRLSKVFVRTAPSNHLYADVQLKWKQNSPPVLTIPWAAEMDRDVPERVEFNRRLP